MLIMRNCYECGETQTQDWDDAFAVPYLKENEHMKLPDGTVVLPPEPCENCNLSWYEMMAHSGMNEDEWY